MFPELGNDPFEPPRSVVYEHAAQAHVDEAASAFPRLPEIMQYLEWQLARYPDNEYAEQMPFPNSDTWLIKIGPYPALGIPAVRLLYQFTEDTVTFWNVRITAE